MPDAGSRAASGMHVDLTDKVAIVTGGSRGLGREMILAMAGCGADVVIASRKIEACQELADDVEQRTGRRALAVACHVGRWDDVDRLVDEAYREFGRVDILVNNAGTAPLYPSLGAVSEELFDKVIGVNLKGPFRLGSIVGERMQSGAGGSIINISSIAACHPQTTDLPYAAAKAGLNTLTVGFAVSFGPKVRSNGVMVGPFLTDISKAWDVEAFSEFARQRFPLQRLGQPAEIVGTVLYLASDASSFTTGTILNVDGGVSVSSVFMSDH
jgi:NAD(P)-dependent dehydrogenase (short-subunit alcohol dehydrogenase family)